MAPRKTADRVAKPKDKPRKSDSGAQAASKADEDLHFMFLCLKSNGGGQVDYQAVADALGITKAAAKQRFYKLRNLFEGTSTSSPRKGAQDRTSKVKTKTEPEEEDDKFKEDTEDEKIKKQMKELDHDLEMKMEEFEDDSKEV